MLSVTNPEYKEKHFEDRWRCIVKILSECAYQRHMQVHELVEGKLGLAETEEPGLMPLPIESVILHVSYQYRATISCCLR
jgi:hypothetical protein